MKYKSEIRDSDIEKLSEKVEKKQYNKYLVALTLESIRGFKNETIRFDFPVTALIAPNGGGKSTIMGAAACMYDSAKPMWFFKNSNTIDVKKKWTLKYEIIDKNIDKEQCVECTIQLRNNRWVRKDIFNRDVAVFSISRTLPAIERKKLSVCAFANFKYKSSQQEELNESVISNASKVLGKSFSGYSRIDIKTDSTISILKGTTTDGHTISEFHFGAGESNVLRMISKIESLEENALILIDEIENGLHPIAVRRLVEYLIDVAERKKVQIIFTTHSNDSLMPLPAKAIWASIDNKLHQGKLDIKSLRAITGETEASLAIFVEDEFAKSWIKAIMAEDGTIIEDEIEIYSMDGDGSAVLMNKHNIHSPTTKCKSICFIDGDSKQQNGDKDKIYLLPGKCPEQYIVEEVCTLISQEEKLKELTSLLHKKPTDSTIIHEKIEKIKLSCRDFHLYFAQLSDEIGYISEDVARDAFLHLWARYSSEAERLSNIIRKNILKGKPKT
jgi:AAA15 family ATPase/GTPase